MSYVLNVAANDARSVQRSLDFEFACLKVVWRREKLHVGLRGQFKEDTRQLGVDEAALVCNLIVNVFFEGLPNFVARLQVARKDSFYFVRVFY